MATSRDKRERRYADAKKRAETHSTGDRTSIQIPDGVKLFNVKKAGTVRLDILPYVVGKGNTYAEPGALYYERTFFTHRGIGPNGDTYICAQKTWEKRCPICEAAAKMRQDPEHDKEVLKGLYAKERQLFLVIDRGNRDDGVQLWDVSYHLFGKLLDFRIDNANPELGYANFFHAEDGMYLEVGFEEKKYGGHSFYEAKSIDFIPRKKPLSEEILEGLPCLDKLPKPIEYDKLKKIFLQAPAEDDDDDSDDDDDDEKPAKKRRQANYSDDDDDTEDDDDEPAPRRRSSDDDDDDDDDEPPRKKRRPARDDDDDDSDDDDDDEPAPRKKKRKPVDDDDSDDDDDDDDQPFDDDDDDDEPAPKKKRRAAADDDDDE